MSAEPLGLFDYLLDALYCVRADERWRARWVMDGEWLTDIQQVADRHGRPLWAPSFGPAPQMLFGLPVVIREGGGAPHLEPSL